MASIPAPGAVSEDELDAFDYILPPGRIAQEPAAGRDLARLLVLRRDGGPLEHREVHDLPALVRPGDLLVVNDSRVRPARLFGRKGSGGRVEALLLERLRGPGPGELWAALLQSRRPVRRGTTLRFPGGMDGVLEKEAGAEPEGEAWLRLHPPRPEDVESLLERLGEVPLPPYIARGEQDERGALDRERYQTIFARRTGSAAAPTAGLHFTPALVDQLEARGVRLASVTLHVGRGTFQPMRCQRLADHRMHPEWCRLPEETAAAMVQTRREGGRVVAVGTTVVRTLEARWDHGPGEGRVDLFLRPGHRFRAVDALLTNFHLPRSTLLVLVAAFAGRERVLGAYREAVERGYRFYSYGDAMLIL